MSQRGEQYQESGHNCWGNKKKLYQFENLEEQQNFFLQTLKDCQINKELELLESSSEYTNLHIASLSRSKINRTALMLSDTAEAELLSRGVYQEFNEQLD